MNGLVAPEVRDAMLARAVDNDDVLSGIRCPVLIVHGADDASIRAETAPRVAALIAGAEVEIWEAVGHSPFWEAPDRFNAALAAFARRAAGGDRAKFWTEPGRATASAPAPARAPTT
jgi:pimeloyl-ACP methyl ester carboxylesterase